MDTSLTISVISSAGYTSVSPGFSSSSYITESTSKNIAVANAVVNGNKKDFS